MLRLSLTFGDCGRSYVVGQTDVARRDLQFLNLRTLPAAPVGTALAGPLPARQLRQRHATGTKHPYILVISRLAQLDTQKDPTITHALGRETALNRKRLRSSEPSDAFLDVLRRSL